MAITQDDIDRITDAPDEEVRRFAVEALTIIRQREETLKSWANSAMAAEARVRELTESRDYFEKQWRDLEVKRASCCDDNEQRADKAEAELANQKAWQRKYGEAVDQLSDAQARVKELEARVAALGTVIAYVRKCGENNDGDQFVREAFAVEGIDAKERT